MLLQRAADGMALTCSKCVARVQADPYARLVLDPVDDPAEFVEVAADGVALLAHVLYHWERKERRS